MSQRILGGVTLDRYENTEGRPLRRDGSLAQNEDEWVYVVPVGSYIALGFGSTDLRLFPNELRGSNPSEGFADTYANFILNPEQLEDTRRGDYFEDNMLVWITTILCEGDECD